MEVSNKQRLASRDALTHCRNIKGKPLNILISFEFPQNLADLSNDIKHIRKVSHYIRMACRSEGDRECLLNWVRKTKPGSGIEQCYILTHCEDANLVAFTKKVLGWNFEKLSVEPIDPLKEDRLRNGRYISLFDEMFAQTDHLTKRWIKDVYSEAGGALRSFRVFNSLSLAKRKLIQHRIDTQRAARLAAINDGNVE